MTHRQFVRVGEDDVTGEAELKPQLFQGSMEQLRLAFGSSPVERGEWP